MRLFRPASPPVPFAKLISPFIFPIKGKPIREIAISSDLSLLEVRSRKADIDKTFDALKKSVEELPDKTKLLWNKSNFQIAGLSDVAIESIKTANQIKAVDSGFFTQLALYETSLQSDIADNSVGLHDFVNSPLHAYYFQLQGFRKEGVQHTIEFPLKSLEMKGLLSQNDLNQIMIKLWLRTSAVRKKQAAKLANLPASTDVVPYVFRMRN